MDDFQGDIKAYFKNDYTDYIYIWTKIGDVVKAQKKLYEHRMKHEKESIMKSLYEGSLCETDYFIRFMKKQEKGGSFLDFDYLKTSVGKLKDAICAEYKSVIKVTRDEDGTQLVLTRHCEGVERVSYVLFVELEKLEKELGQTITPVKLFDLEIDYD